MAPSMPFGKHKGELLSTLPGFYLEWLSGLELREPLKSNVAAELESRKNDGAPAPETEDVHKAAVVIVEKGFAYWSERVRADATRSEVLRKAANRLFQSLGEPSHD